MTNKIMNIKTGECLGEITTNHSMSLAEALELLDIKVMTTKEDYDNQNGVEYDDLALV